MAREPFTDDDDDIVVTMRVVVATVAVTVDNRSNSFCWEPFPA